MNKQIARTIFLNSFQKEIRNKTFWFLLISSLLVMLAGRAFFKELSLHVENGAPLQQFDLYFYYFITAIWSGLVMALLGTHSIKSDIQYGVSEQILAFPIRSESYLFLRLSATSILSWFFYLILMGTTALFLYIGNHNFLPLKTLIAIFIFLGTIMAVTTLASLWSLLLGQISGFLALLFSVAIISYINKNIAQLELLYIPGQLIYWLLPHLGVLSQICNDLIFEQSLSDGIKLWIEIPHFILSMILLFWGTHFIFKKRGFK